MVSRTTTGARGEAIVAEYLEARGFEIVARNARVGRLEIDLIARRGGLLVFCEVRSRMSAQHMDPIATLGRDKAQRIRRAAAQWLSGRSMRADELRFDAAGVLLGGAEPTIEYYEAAF